MDDEVPQFRFTITDRTFKIITTVVGIVVVAYKAWVWSIDNAVRARDLQADHQRFKEMLLGVDKNPGMYLQAKDMQATILRMDADLGKLWLDVDAIKKWRDAMLPQAAQGGNGQTGPVK